MENKYNVEFAYDKKNCRMRGTVDGKLNISCPVLKLGQFAVPKTCENWLGHVKSCVYYAHQTQ